MADYHQRCWLASFVHLMKSGNATERDSLGRLDRFESFTDPTSDFTTMVADLDGVAIGHTTVSGSEVVHLFVDPDHQGIGLGRQLLGIAESLLLDAGHTEVELCTIVGNEPAIELYRSAGWLMTDRLVNNVEDGLEYDEHVMVKTLVSDSP